MRGFYPPVEFLPVFGFNRWIFFTYQIDDIIIGIAFDFR
jgi:hypothetical protein